MDEQYSGEDRRNMANSYKIIEAGRSWSGAEISQEMETYGENNERSVIMYIVQVSVQLNNSEPIVYSVKRRFTHWVNLHEELQERYPNMKVPPGFPTRTIIRARSSTIHSRAEYFQKYLKSLHNDAYLANSSTVLTFLELNSIIQCLAVGTMLGVELSPVNSIHKLKEVVAGLVGIIHIRVDLRLSKVMIKGFIGAQAIADALQQAGFNIAAAPKASSSSAASP